MNNNKKSIEDIRAEMIAEDYNRGTAWQQKFLKKIHYKHFEKALALYYIDLVQEIMNEKAENEWEWTWK